MDEQNNVLSTNSQLYKGKRLKNLHSETSE